MLGGRCDPRESLLRTVNIYEPFRAAVAALPLFLHGMTATPSNLAQRPCLLTFNGSDRAARERAFWKHGRRIGVDVQRMEHARVSLTGRIEAGTLAPFLSIARRARACVKAFGVMFLAALGGDAVGPIGAWSR